MFLIQDEILIYRSTEEEWMKFSAERQKQPRHKHQVRRWDQQAASGHHLPGRSHHHHCFVRTEEAQRWSQQKSWRWQQSLKRGAHWRLWEGIRPTSWMRSQCNIGPQHGFRENRWQEKGVFEKALNARKRWSRLTPCSTFPTFRSIRATLSRSDVQSLSKAALQVRDCPARPCARRIKFYCRQSSKAAACRGLQAVLKGNSSWETSRKLQGDWKGTSGGSILLCCKQ